VRAVSDAELIEVYPIHGAIEEVAAREAAKRLKGDVTALEAELEALMSACRVGAPMGKQTGLSHSPSPIRQAALSARARDDNEIVRAVPMVRAARVLRLPRSAAVASRADICAALWQSISEAPESQGGAVQGQRHVGELLDSLRVHIDVAQHPVYPRELGVEMR
jgi:hypothetical protein